MSRAHGSFSSLIFISEPAFNQSASQDLATLATGPVTWPEDFMMGGVRAEEIVHG
jgi:hypothetical protein